MGTPANNQAHDYPRDGHGFVRQCAWCLRVADADGRYRLVTPTLVHGASHGCCEACAIRFLSPDVESRLAA
jgi:hypothetical protein